MLKPGEIRVVRIFRSFVATSVLFTSNYLDSVVVWKFVTSGALYYGDYTKIFQNDFNKNENLL